MTNLVLIGVGRWGKNILRTLQGMRGVEVIALQKGDDIDPTSPRLPASAKATAGKRGEKIDGVLVATPGSTHTTVALPFVKRGLPVFIEKPMATTVADAQKLMQAATKSGSRIFVGHVHLYNSAYLKLRQLLPKIGAIKLIYFEGMAPGPVRDDMSVLWDWGPHGVSMVLDMLGKGPSTVQAWGQKVLGPHGKLHDVVQARLSFPGKVEALLSLSWINPEKRVKLTVIGSRGALVFDDTAVHKVTLYQTGRMSHPRYSARLPLAEELTAFVRTAKTGRASAHSLARDVAVIRTLAQIERAFTAH